MGCERPSHRLDDDVDDELVKTTSLLALFLPWSVLTRSINWNKSPTLMRAARRSRTCTQGEERRVRKKKQRADLYRDYGIARKSSDMGSNTYTRTSRVPSTSFVFKPTYLSFRLVMFVCLTRCDGDASGRARIDSNYRLTPVNRQSSKINSFSKQLLFKRWGTTEAEREREGKATVLNEREREKYVVVPQKNITYYLCIIENKHAREMTLSAKIFD